MDPHYLLQNRVINNERKRGGENTAKQEAEVNL